MKNNTIHLFLRRGAVVLLLGGAGATVLAEPVQAPPLPPGSGNVQVEAGLSPDEVARHKRAHKHSKLEKKDPTRDDSLTDLSDASVPVKPKSPTTLPKSK